MSQTVDAKKEPLKWPIAPDGYIPNSVIRSWGVKLQTEFSDDLIFYTHDEEDFSTRVFCFSEDEEEEEEKTDGVKKMRKEDEDEKNEKYNKEKGEVEKKDKREMDCKERAGEKKDEKSYNIQRKTDLQKQLKTFDYGKPKPQMQEVASTYSSTKTMSVMSTSCHENGPLTQRGEDMKLCETITPPLAAEWTEPPVEHPVVSADTFITSKELKITVYIPSIEDQHWTSHTETPVPTIPEDLQPQPDLGPTECSPVTDKRFLLSSAKYNNITEQVALPLNQKVLKLYKKYKSRSKISSHHGKLSTVAERPPSSKAMQFTIQTVRTSLNSGLGSSPAFWTHRIIKPKYPSYSLYSDYPAQIAQTTHPIKDQRDHKLMAEWRKSLYKLISLQGFRSPRAARLATTEHPEKPSHSRQLETSIPSMQPDQVSVHQRVVQKILMKDTLEMASTCFHHVIPMAAQHSFFTLDPCGMTQYGKLQFDWMRGLEEDKLLRVSTAKTKDTANKTVQSFVPS